MERKYKELPFWQVKPHFSEEAQIEAARIYQRIDDIEKEIEFYKNEIEKSNKSERTAAKSLDEPYDKKKVIVPVDDNYYQLRIIGIWLFIYAIFTFGCNLMR